MIYNAIVLKKRNWLSGLFYKEIMYVDTLSLNITNKIQAAGVRFKPKTSFTNETYCLVYCLVRSTYKNLEKFLKNVTKRKLRFHRASPVITETFFNCWPAGFVSLQDF